MARHTDEATGSRTPRLRVSDKKKVANDFEHTKSVMDNYISASSFIEDLAPSGAYRDVRLLYEAYNNRLPESFFNYVTNPLNSAQAEYTNWPARLRSYSIIRPNIDLLEGEYEKRPFSFAIKVHNADAVNLMQEAEYQQILGALQQQFVNMIAEQGGQAGQDPQQVELPEKIRAKFGSNYKDQRAVMGEAALNIIMDECRLEEMFKKLFNDWLIAGECYSYKGIRSKNIVYERVSPLDLDYDKSPDKDYIEDGQWVVRRMYLTPAELYDMLYEELDEEDIDEIEDSNGVLSFRTVGATYWQTLRSDEDLRRNKVSCYHVVWKYLTKVGILSYPNDQTGEIEEIEVPENYKPNKELGESVTWYWVNEVWEGYKLLNDKYFGIRPLPNQRSTMNNLSSCKLPYNGRRYSDLHSQNLSIVELGIPYEILHRILHFNLEKTIAKSKGKIVLIDKNVIPKKFGWDEEKFIYWGDATGWGLIDRSQPGVDKNFNQYQVLDLGLYDHIQNLIAVMEFIKQEWDELVGITRQRKGQTQASDTATSVQNAIYQSSVISEKVFSRYEEFVEKELQGMLDVSKLAWLDGKQRLYHGDDMRSHILSLDPGLHLESEYGVYVSRSARDIQNLEIARQNVQAMLQNGLPPSAMVGVLQARSLSKLRGILEEAEQKSMAAQQQQQVSEQEAVERQLLIQQAFEQAKGVVEERLIHVKYDREEDLEMLKQTGVDQNPESIEFDSPLEAQKAQQDHQIKREELALKKQSELNKQRVEAVKAAQKDRELSLKAKEIQVKEQLGKLQARVAMKNKVAGEK
jgi:hypothetical protein